MSIKKILNKYPVRTGIEPERVPADISQSWEAAEEVQTRVSGHDEQVREPVYRKPLTNWRDSESVVKLFDYIKQHRAEGVTLLELSGCPTLHMNPPGGFTKEFISMALHAERLAHDAKEDLYELMGRGCLRLKQRVLS